MGYTFYIIDIFIAILIILILILGNTLNDAILAVLISLLAGFVSARLSEIFYNKVNVKGIVSNIF